MRGVRAQGVRGTYDKLGIILENTNAADSNLVLSTSGDGDNEGKECKCGEGDHVECVHVVGVGMYE